ncbi:MAG: TetR family transcriptional regulator C-terminal domain-containing protein [Leptospiraceae bacterium]|nr:TetR family transcriptional regulator C-terminal domain-containing protein [Leptospiraceae bacterium]MCP5493893.1 TetR family transcriptional regulator C-terminal domain-containing protein [Leptospiraceae bacterium]
MKKRETKRKEILNKTYHLIQLKGYHATGIKELADEAGMPKGSFFNYFQNKEDYILAAIELYTIGAVQQSSQILNNQNINPIERIKKFYQSRIDQTQEQIEKKMSCLLNILSQEVGVGSSDLGKLLEASLDKIKKPLEDCLQEAKVLNQILPNADPIQLAEFLENSWRGALIIAKARNNLQPIFAFKHILETIFITQGEQK